MTVEIKSDGSLFDEFFRLKHEIIKKYGVEPRGDIRNATAEKMLIEQAYLKGYIDGKAEAMQWIPCSERLPEEGAVVLVSLEEDEDWSWVRLVREGYYDEGYWFDTDGSHYGLEVLAWMP